MFEMLIITAVLFAPAAGAVKYDGATEQCKREYDGKTNSRW